MKIANRKDKLLSDKLFCELVILYIFQEQAEVYEHELEHFVNKSKRTIYRYMEDLNKTDLFRSRGIKTRVTNEGLKKYSAYDEDFYASDGTPLLMLTFVCKNIKGLHSDDKHIARLTRCAILMHELKCKRESNLYTREFWDDDFVEDDDMLYISNKDVEEAKKYYYEELELTYSEKTFKRDLLAALYVIYYMKLKNK